MARVCGVIAAAIAAGSALQVAGSMSTSRGVAPQTDDRSGGREERECRRDDFVAGTDAERHQRDDQRVGSRRHADGVADANGCRELLFERVDLRAADEPLTVADAGDRCKDLVAQRTIWLLQIEKRNVHGPDADQRVTISGAPQSGRSFRLSDF